MNQAQPESKSESLFSHRVQTERRSFFFHVKKAPEGEPYLTIGQYARLGDEWVRLKIVVPAEDARAFYQGLCEGFKAMRAAKVSSPAAEGSEGSLPAGRQGKEVSRRKAAARA